MSKHLKSELSTSTEKSKTKREVKVEKADLVGKLNIANKLIAKRAAELVLSNEDKEKWAAEMIIANAEKAKHAAELVIANSEKVRRAAVLVIANLEKAKRADELIIADKELAFQNEERVRQAAEFVIADVNKTKREAELVIAKIEKAKRLAKSIIGDKVQFFQTEEKSIRAAELVIADAEKARHEAELIIANIKKANRSAENLITNVEKARRSAELVITYKELVYQKSEKAKRAAELIIANVVKARRAAEFVIANIDKTKRAAELVITNKERVLAAERAKHTAELIKVNKELNHQIEKREQTELALNESNEKYLKAFQSSPYLIIITKMDDGKIMEVNDTFVLLSGYSRKEALSNSTIEFNMWNDIDERKSVVSALRLGKTVEGKEFAFRKKNGEIRIGLYSAKNITGQNEPYIISSIADITERKKAENLLKESEQKTTSIMENSADAIFLTNREGKYFYTNKAVSVMLGYTSEEMKKKRITDITNPNKHVEILRIFRQVLNEGKSFNEIELLKKDGSYISADLNAIILPDGTIYGSCRDITERKQAESDLIMAKEHAEESDRLKSAFLANMSHEIRTPMNGILGFAGLLKEPELSGEQQQEYIDIIEKSGARMLNIINDIVSISKIESGTLETFFSDTNINGQTEYVYNILKLDAEKKNLTLSLKNGLPNKDSVVKTDNEKFIGILSNLVKNAIKFTDRGSIEFGYTLKEGGSSDAFDNLEFYIKDSGIGIPKDRQKVIFERFIQADIHDKMARQGAGLGLAISRAYVEMLGGKIWLRSEPNQGSTFYFSIPYNSRAKKIPTKSKCSTDLDHQVQLKILKVLIVEDDETSEALLKEMIQKSSKEILTTNNGLDALNLCRQNPDLDLILMDIQILGLNGYETTRQIRKFNKDVVIIAQTSFGLSGDRKKSIEAGCNDYISKPINKEELMEMIQYHFKN